MPESQTASAQVSEVRGWPREAFSASQADNAGSIPVIRSRHTDGQVVRDTSMTWLFLFPGVLAEHHVHPRCPDHPRHHLGREQGEQVHDLLRQALAYCQDAETDRSQSRRALSHLHRLGHRLRAHESSAPLEESTVCEGSRHTRVSARYTATIVEAPTISPRSITFTASSRGHQRISWASLISGGVSVRSAPRAR